MSEPLFTITREHVEQMIENSYKKSIRNKLADCSYAAPCIIGSIVPKDKRDLLDCVDLNSSDIESLVRNGFVKLEGVDITALRRAQMRFDSKPHDVRRQLKEMREALKESLNVKEETNEA